MNLRISRRPLYRTCPARLRKKRNLGGAQSDAELQDAYLDVLRQFGLELVCGVDSHSHWMNDLLVIVANQGPIHASQTAFYAILVELDRRGLDWPEEERRGGEE